MRILGWLILLAVVASSYFIYPFATVWWLADALQRRDVIAVDAMVDWRQVRDNFRVDVMASAGASSKDDSPLGLAVAGPALDRLIETYANARVVTDRVSELLDTVPDKGEVRDWVGGARFVGPVTFEFGIRTPAMAPWSPTPTVVMELQTLRWRVIRLVVPDLKPLIPRSSLEAGSGSGKGGSVAPAAVQPLAAPKAKK